MGLYFYSLDKRLMTNAILLWQKLSYNATLLCLTLVNLNTQNQVLKGVTEKSLSAFFPSLLNVSI